MASEEGNLEIKFKIEDGEITVVGAPYCSREILEGDTPKFCFRLADNPYGDYPYTGYMKPHSKGILEGDTPKFAWRTNMFYNEGAPYTGYMNPKMSTIQYDPDPYREEYINLLDRIHVYSPPHGLDKDFPVLEMEIPLNKPEDTKFQLGSKNTISLTNINASYNEELKNRIQNMPKPSSILKAAQENATALINAGTEGYVTLVKKDGSTRELIIADRPDYTEDGARLWRWNENGLGFSSNGLNGPFSTAMTSDGQIVGERIIGLTVHGDQISGGTLSLGGYDNQNGTAVIYGANNGLETHLDNMGMSFYRNGQYYSRLHLGSWFYEGTPAVVVTGEYGCGFVIDTDWVGVRASDGDVYSTLTNDIQSIPFVSGMNSDEEGNQTPVYSYLLFCNGIFIGIQN